MLLSRILVAAASTAGVVGRATSVHNRKSTNKARVGRLLEAEVFGKSGDFGDDSDSDDAGFTDMVMGGLDMFKDDFDECGVDLSSILGDGSAEQLADPAAMDPSAILDELKFSTPCTAQQTSTMRDEFLAFETCSGYELMELDEVALSAVMGAMMRCANSLSMMDIISMDIPAQCAEAFLGNHALGKALRDVLLRPGKTGECFLELSHKIPQCTLDLWPYPIDGKAIQKASCLSSKLDEFMNEQCVEGLQTLNTCLPATKDEIASESCDTYIQECGSTDSMYLTVLFMMPPHLQGMPLPDTCSSTALSQGLGSVVERYETFRSTCAQTGVDMWTKLDSDSGPTLETFEHFLQVGDSKKPAGDSSDVKTKGEEDSKNTQSPKTEFPSKLGSQEPSDSGSSGGSAATFGYGMLSGVLVAVLSFVAFVFYQKRRGGSSIVDGLELGAMGDEKYSDIPARDTEVI